MTTFITVGNGEKPFIRLFNQLENLFELMPQPVIAQCGNTEFKSQKIKTYKFIELGKFKKYISKSKLVICHAGMGTMMQAIQLNKIPVCVPRLKKYDEIINDHQVNIAKALGEQKKIIYVKNLSRIGFYIKKSLEIQEKTSYKFENNQPFFLEFEKILDRLNEDIFKKN